MDDDETLLARIEVDDRSAHSPVVLHVPHGSRFVPLSSRGAFSLPDDELEAELDRITDAGTDDLARRIDGPSRVVSRLSRLVVDVERFEGDEEEMLAVGMGALYTHGTQRQPIRHLDEHERLVLLAHHRHYGERFADLVDRVLAVHGRAVILDLHSYPRQALPYELHRADRRPQLCVGVDERHTPASLVDAVREVFGGWDVAVNQPFRGAYVPRRHLGDARVASVMLEFRRDVFGRAVDEERVQRVAARVAQVVHEVAD